MSARTRKDWILWGALGCALVSTAHAEYTLATAAHFNKYVALAVPGALDLYVVRALQQRRDVFIAVLAMVAANVTSHLIAGGVLGVRWPVIAAVGAVAPLIVWRVYSLKYESGAVSAPALGDEYAALEHECGWVRRALNWLGWRECGCECALEDPSPDAKPQVSPYSEPSAPAPDALEYGPLMKWGSLGADPLKHPGIPAWVPGYHLDGCDGVHAHSGPFHCAARASALSSTAPDHIPADWMDDEYPETHPSTTHSETSAAPHLAPVPDLPAEYEASAVHSETSTPVLQDTDWEYLPGAQEYVDKYTPATVKGLRRAFRDSGNGIGQDRAERLLAHLGVRP